MWIGENYRINILGSFGELSVRLKRFLEDFGFNVVVDNHHVFKNGGCSGFFLLSESHLSYHTWPEHSFATIDLFTCKKVGRDVVVEYFEDKFPDTSVTVLKWDTHVGGEL